MIQRIQTIWMVLTAGLVFSPIFAGWWEADIWPLAIIVITAIVPLVAVFFYKNRSRQTSILIAEFVLLLGTAGFAVYNAWVTHTMWSYAPMFVFAAMVTNWLALRGVLRDTMLLKNADRLR